MSDILSQSELDALLSALGGGEDYNRYDNKTNRNYARAIMQKELDSIIRKLEILTNDIRVAMVRRESLITAIEAVPEKQDEEDPNQIKMEL